MHSPWSKIRSYDLAEDIEQELFAGFVEIMEEIRALGANAYYSNIERCNTVHFEQYFHYIRAHYYEFKILFSANYASGFTSRFSRVIFKNRMKTRQKWYGYSSEEAACLPAAIAYREEILSSLYISLFSVWINRNMDLPEKQMAQMLIEIWKPLRTLDEKSGKGGHHFPSVL